MAEHAANTGRFGGCNHAPRIDEAALLHDFDLDDVGGVRLDDIDETRVVEHRLIRHDRYTARLTPHLIRRS